MYVKSKYMITTKSMHGIYFIYFKYCQGTTKAMYVKSRYTIATKSMYAIYFMYCKYCQGTTKAMYVKSRYTIAEKSMDAIDYLFIANNIKKQLKQCMLNLDTRLQENQ